jgi:phosphoribosylformylglycinamidine cyclo-ligase
MGSLDMSSLDRGDSCSAALFQAALRSIEARAGHFGAPAVLENEGLRHVVLTELGPYGLMLSSDGVGTKMEVAERLGRYRSVGYDLVAMLVDDAVRFGAQPLSMSNVLDCTRAEQVIGEQLAEGLAAAAAEAEVAVVSGEVAELGSRVRGWDESGGYNWAGTLLSVVRRERLLTGSALRAGDAVVALREPGFRSNGFTLARNVLYERYGVEWQRTAAGGTERNWGAELLEPSRIYAPALLDAIGRFETEPAAAVTGIVHVTGGGVPGKLARLLRGRGLGAELGSLFAPPAAMLEIQRLGELPDRDAYRTWCMGQGLLVVTPEPEALIEIVVRRGHEAQLAGHLERGRSINIISRGVQLEGKRLQFDVEAS